MRKFRAELEYKPSEEAKEVALFRVEQMALNKVIPYIREKAFSYFSIENSHKYLANYADLAYVNCVVLLKEQEK